MWSRHSVVASGSTLKAWLALRRFASTFTSRLPEDNSIHFASRKRNVQVPSFRLRHSSVRLETVVAQRRPATRPRRVGERDGGPMDNNNEEVTNNDCDGCAQAIADIATGLYDAVTERGYGVDVTLDQVCSRPLSRNVYQNARVMLNHVRSRFCSPARRRALPKGGHTADHWCTEVFNLCK